MVTGSPSYATRSVTLTVVVSTGVTGDIHWCEQSTIYLFWQIACGRPPVGRRPFRKMVNIFAYTCPNRSGVGAINNPDRSEQVFDAYYISEASKKFHGRHFDGPSLENVSFWWL